jgi:oligosaccharyltransferase complex subunit alpha (ribophorin I)
VSLPNPLEVNSTIHLVLETVQTHVTWPWPEAAAQGDEQALKYETDLFVLSPYRTSAQRTKLKYARFCFLISFTAVFRSPTPTIRFYTTPENLGDFTFDAPVTKSGATVTYGPYNSIPASASAEFIASHQQKVLIHYNYDFPVIEVSTLKRSAEISHWGANLNIQDEIRVRNAGSKSVLFQLSFTSDFPIG